MDHYVKLLLGVLAIITTTSCVMEQEQTEEPGGEFLGYVDEYGTSVAHYAVNGICDCDGSGIDADCNYRYYSPTDICIPDPDAYQDANISDWVINDGTFVSKPYNGYGLVVYCGISVTRNIYASGEVAIKVYGHGPSVYVYQSAIYGSGTLSHGSCTFSGHGSCIVTDVDPNYDTDYLGIYARIYMTPDEHLNAIRVCYDANASD